MLRTCLIIENNWTAYRGQKCIHSYFICPVWLPKGNCKNDVLPSKNTRLHYPMHLIWGQTKFLGKSNSVIEFENLAGYQYLGPRDIILPWQKRVKLNGGVWFQNPSNIRLAWQLYSFHVFSCKKKEASLTGDLLKVPSIQNHPATNYLREKSLFSQVSLLIFLPFDQIP